MRIPRIHTTATLAEGQQLELEPAAVRHLCQVLRLQRGDSLRLFNGDGYSYPATLIEASRKHAVARIEGAGETGIPESPLYIHLGIALSKGERFELVLQKAAELGAARITPLFTRRVDVRLGGERLQKKQRHWRQILVSACEQCGRNCLPDLDEPARLSDWLRAVNAQRRLLLAPAAPTGLAEHPAPSSAALLIGPEGGLDEEEIAEARRHHFEPLALGPRILRTETAPLAALAILQHRWGDMGGDG